MKNSKSMIILLVSLALLTLVVFIGAFFFYPKETAKTVVTTPVTTPAAGTATGTPVPDEFDPVEWTRNPSTPGLQTPTAPAAGDNGFTVTLPPAPAAGTTLPPSPGATFPGDTPATPETVKSTPVVKAAPVAKAPAAKPAPKPVKTVKVAEFWIQVASFKDRYQAENTAKTLEAQGLKGILTTATVNGSAVVRVRVGPYTAEAEAAKFLEKLKTVKEFEGSYITKATATKTL